MFTFESTPTCTEDREDTGSVQYQEINGNPGLSTPCPLRSATFVDKEKWELRQGMNTGNSLFASTRRVLFPQSKDSSKTKDTGNSLGRKPRMTMFGKKTREWMEANSKSVQ